MFSRRQITEIVNPVTILQSNEKDGILATCTSWMNLPDIMVSERRGTQKEYMLNNSMFIKYKSNKPNLW